MKYILMIAIAVTAFTTGAHTASAEGFKDKVSKFQSMSNEEKAAMGQQIKSNWEGLSEEEKAAVSATVQAKGQEAIDKWNTLPAEQQQEILDAAHIKAQDTAAQAKTKWDSIPEETKQQAEENAKAKWNSIPEEQKAKAKSVASEKKHNAKSKFQGRFGQ